MDPPQPWHDGCYCYRDDEVEEARELGFEVKCGGGLPCSCTIFGDSSFAPIDPLFNRPPGDEWDPMSGDPLKPDDWAAQDDMNAQSQSPQQQERQQEHQQQNPQQQSNQVHQQRAGPLLAGTKKGPSDINKCCGCPCAKLHRAAAKRKRCCGDNCQCWKGDCACPDHIVSASGRCCEGDARHLPLPGSRLSVVRKASVRSTTPLPEPTSDVSTPDNSVGLAHDDALSLSNKATPAGSFRQSSLQQHKTKRARMPSKIEPTQSSYRTATIAELPLVQTAAISQPLSAIAVQKGTNVVSTDGTSGPPEDSSSGLVFSCSDCSQKFATQRELESHSAKKHLKNRPYTCYTCSASFLFKQNRDRHIVEVHHGKRPHQCPHDQCHAAFKNSSGLKQHMRTVHDKERPFKCEQCQSSFGQRNHLTQHVLVVHERRKLFQCTICDTSFSNRGNLNQHMRRKHGDHPIAPTNSRSNIPAGNP